LREIVLRKTVRKRFKVEIVYLMFVCALLGLSSLAHAQLDIAVSGSSTWSSQNSTASVGFLPPAIRGGSYPGAYLGYRLTDRLGFSVEGDYRYHKAIYDGLQPYRPVFYDVNAVYAWPFTSKVRGDFMGGVGGETLIFYNSIGTCGPTGGCQTYFNSTHFATHFGVGVRYYFFRNFYVRPEGHWDYIPNNFQFHSNNVYRYGVSIGHTFGTR